MDYYYSNRESNMDHAIKHTEYVKSTYSEFIDDSVRNSIIYDYHSPESIYNKVDKKLDEPKIYPIDKNCDINYIKENAQIHNPLLYNGNVSIVKSTTVDHIKDIDINNKIAVLNFASYKNPGGKFLEGSMAQEESLCHHSTLYPVLERCNKFYEFNRAHLNNSLYNHRVLYTPHIIFDGRCMVDVLTCAFPNMIPYVKYNKPINMDYYNDLLSNRVDSIFHTAYLNRVDTLILGAIGCGVFKNSPSVVANIFINRIKDVWIHKFSEITFAIPDDYTINIFASTFKEIL